MALESALEKGHAEASLMMSYALLQGSIYPRDLVMALAYMHIAEQKAAHFEIDLYMYPSLKNTIVQNMSPEEIAEAEKVALELQLEFEN